MSTAKTYSIPMDFSITIASLQVRIPRSRKRWLDRLTPPPSPPPTPKKPRTGPREVGFGAIYPLNPAGPWLDFGPINSIDDL